MHMQDETIKPCKSKQTQFKFSVWAYVFSCILLWKACERLPLYAQISLVKTRWWCAEILGDNLYKIHVVSDDSVLKSTENDIVFFFPPFSCCHTGRLWFCRSIKLITSIFNSNKSFPVTSYVQLVVKLPLSIS